MTALEIIMTVEYPTVCLKARRARPFFGRHPWVFSSAIDSVIAETDSLDPGTCVKLVTDKGEFVAWGLWNDKSTIHVRLYSWDQERPFDDYLIRQRINTAVEQRRLRFELSPAHGGRTGCRLIFSEGDELSGLTVDYYAGFLLVQFTSLALYQYRETILQTLQEAVQPLGIWLRTEKGVRDAEGLEAVDGLLSGESPPRPLFIAEHGIQYGVDVQEGQK
ncbi:MAG TPA: class I SAM-dependent rRNA methyltransferase, partial [Planctomycetaceae bacterium]|nr:class I SAM-dependent rRNA methyltransferase [Planctomycetaceae bacterium]